MCENINPVERIERSALIMAKSFLDVGVEELVVDREKVRIQTYSPTLFTTANV